MKQQLTYISRTVVVLDLGAYQNRVDQKLSISRHKRKLTMVLGGQDAWRKHPLISGCWKKPFPHMGLALGLFGVYLAGDYMFNVAMKIPDSHHAAKPKYKFIPAGDLGDTMPEVEKRGGGHH